MGYDGLSMSINAREAYSEGRKPVSSITKEDISNYDINESLAFFKWYVHNFCRSSEWHHSSPKFNETNFYNIKECCDQFKKLKEANIKLLKDRYKNELKSKTKQSKSNPDYSEKPYYAKINYSITTYKGSRKYFDAYAVICKNSAYYYDEFYKEYRVKRINGSHFSILEKYESRPDEMAELVSNEISDKYNLCWQ